jgi:hypothetical protein
VKGAKLNEVRDRNCDKDRCPMSIEEALLMNWSAGDLGEGGNLDQREDQDGSSCPA